MKPMDPFLYLSVLDQLLEADDKCCHFINFKSQAKTTKTNIPQIYSILPTLFSLSTE